MNQWKSKGKNNENGSQLVRWQIDDLHLFFFLNCNCYYEKKKFPTFARSMRVSYDVDSNK